MFFLTVINGLRNKRHAVRIPHGVCFSAGSFLSDTLPQKTANKKGDPSRIPPLNQSSDESKTRIRPRYRA